MVDILIIDNYDSFTHNLVHLFLKFDVRIDVIRNDKIDGKGILELSPDVVVISPGPKNPSASGNTKEIISKLVNVKPIFGVCLGMQAINEVFGGITVHAPEPVHGKTSLIHHQNACIFAGLPSPFKAARYHSLVISDMPDCLKVTARSADNLPMAVTHRQFPICGVQFHPESFLTEYGYELVRNFFDKVNLNV